MIKLQDWQIYKCDQLLSTAEPESYDIAFVSKNAIDERTNWAKQYLEKVSGKIKTVSFSYDEASLEIDDEVLSIRDLSAFEIDESSSILIDATSLAFPELLYLFLILHDKQLSFDVLYVQPNDYGNGPRVRSGEIQPIRLSEDGLGPKQLPPFIQLEQKSSMLVFLGFEGHRLGSLANSDAFNIPEYSCLVGVPGFKPGWENKTIYNNMAYLQKLNIQNLHIAGANDPVYTYDVIEKEYEAAQYDRKNFFLAPLGTKPAGIAAAYFAVNNRSNLSIVYDFIQNTVGRSTGADTAHKWCFGYESRA
jgi:hypothetical protein